MISFCAITDLRGKLLSSRDYQGNIKVDVDYYVQQLGKGIPMINQGNKTYISHKSHEIILLTCSMGDVDAARIMFFLEELANILTEIYGELTSRKIEENISGVHYILDEVCDGGFCTIDEYRTLLGRELVKKIQFKTNWIMGVNNDIYVDLDESVNLSVGTCGEILIYEVKGTLHVHKKTGGPLQIGLGTGPNTLINLDVIRLASGVKRQESEIVAILGKKKTEILHYTTLLSGEPLIWVTGMVRSASGTRYIYEVELKCNFPKKYYAQEVVVEIPVCEDTVDPRVGVSGGRAIYSPQKSILLWKLRNIGGDRMYKLKAEYHVSTMRNPNLPVIPQHPIKASFNLSGYTITGLQIRYVHARDEKTRVWVKYQTLSDEYYMRLSSETKPNEPID